MSRAESGESMPERAVRNPSIRSRSLHRLDEDADEPVPACPEGEYRDDVGWLDVPSAAYPTYEPCRNPECFGREWR